MEFAAAADEDDQRRIRRMISNRESARRSRMRKQRHLEDLRSRVGWLRLENRALADRLAGASGQCAAFCQENGQLRLEAAALSRRLLEIRRILLLRQLQRLSAPSAFSSSICAGGLRLRSPIQ
ncbi:Ocs element-binding factor 1 [Apostasia shenzhenica]|uniref:Ocs element-binding factor 1 n=1 Tax=Apostasia shenzhenica TaxID=1088818 RepID=A0A2I0BDV9_9ASPA|nr:Ocs element-binding factor 1 [Apostasia shenzhenica]